MLQEEIVVCSNTKDFPFDYKLLEFRLIINKKLYEAGVIDFQIYKSMEENIISRMRKIARNY